MDVFEIGTEVLLDRDIPARVTAICIKGTEHRLTYEVTWWDERQRKSEWVGPYEIRSKQEAKMRSLRFA
jgi:hypothetical protein